MPELTGWLIDFLFPVINTLIEPFRTIALVFTWAGQLAIDLFFAIPRLFGELLVLPFRLLWDNVIEPIFGPIFYYIQEIIQIIQLLISIVLGFFEAFIMLIFTAFRLVGELLGAYYNAPVTAIPGLPQCVTAPQNSDICAVYYIADWTLFAPGTPGELIVPLLVILLDIVIVMFFVRKALAIVNSGEEAINV